MTLDGREGSLMVSTAAKSRTASEPKTSSGTTDTRNSDTDIERGHDVEKGSTRSAKLADSGEIVLSELPYGNAERV